MITNQSYWLLMVKVELSDRLELIKHQMKIIQAKLKMILMKSIKLLEMKFTQIKERRQVTKIPSSSIK